MKKFITKRRIFCAAVIAAIIIVPFLYSYFYLGAFWDPYSKLQKLPVAVVNEDQGAVINGESRNLGQEFCDRLKEDASLKFTFTTAEDARKGTEGKAYYAFISIPGEFSKDIASASTSDKKTAVITYSPNEKRNFLASQILNRAVLEMEEKTRASVNKEIVQELSDKLREVPDQMTDLKEGIGKLDDGAGKLVDGTKTLSDGTETLHDGTKKLEDGANTLTTGTAEIYYRFGDYKEGVTSLQKGLGNLAEGAGKLETGTSQLKAGTALLAQKTQKLGAISTGVTTIAEGTKSFDNSLTQYTKGVNSLLASVSSTSSFLTQYVKANPGLMKDAAFAAFIAKLSDPAAAQNMAALQAAGPLLTGAHAQLVEGANQLKAGTAALTELNPAIASLSEGAAKVENGAAGLSDGSQKLVDGAGKLGAATNQLYSAAGDIHEGADKLQNGVSDVNSGVQELNDGAGDLYNGAKDLKDGTGTAKDGVDTAITDSKEQLDKLDGIADYAEAPVTVQQDNVTSISNYGTAFAPYFMSLSLWVGALILFVGIYLDTEGKFKILSRESNHKIARSFIFLLIGFAQALALAAVVQLGLGLKVENTILFYASVCLVSMVFIAIVQFLIVHLKSAGKLLSIVLLILQLTSCGGTFPMETVPKIFNILFPYMPMTYSVALFKQAITDTDIDAVLYNGGVLVAILVVFMVLTIMISAVKNKKAVKSEVGLPIQFE